MGIELLALGSIVLTIALGLIIQRQSQTIKALASQVEAERANAEAERVKHKHSLSNQKSYYKHKVRLLEDQLGVPYYGE